MRILAVDSSRSSLDQLTEYILALYPDEEQTGDVTQFRAGKTDNNIE